VIKLVWRISVMGNFDKIFLLIMETYKINI
jgi:hypothetical protein